ncbi:hypothetical protein HYH03_005407 [Edaphochlamys debaryana]|uniref:MYND-type domain-containing protein n=1 Tax=Edaphochlamys debaryana TaxID=47281 RepID=A0A836C1B8_9CHLO|nr:hypothetical protein HYH03_005407 [Edaphochlamys debaryana]|eukprot:KAG2496585.1 hypothetical protein HYH03_005407 [Edaphochlamys debaryana]
MRGGWKQGDGARPFLWFARADTSLADQDIGAPRQRLVRELHPILQYMQQSDLEKPNEPVVILFTRLSTELIRSGLAQRPGGRASQQGPPGQGHPYSALTAASCASAAAVTAAGGLSAVEATRLKALRAAVHEARARVNPRFVLVVPVQAPWQWTFALLRSYQNLQSALHRLAPAAALVVVERPPPGGVPQPRLVLLDDLTPPADTIGQLKHKLLLWLKPLLQWMAEEDMEGEAERLPVLHVCVDAARLAQRFVARDPVAEAEAEADEAYGAYGGGSPAGGAGAGALEDLSGSELQRMLLARDRLYEAVDVLQPRLLVLVPWQAPSRWVVVLCRDYARLLVGLTQALPDRPVYVWKPRRLPRPRDEDVVDFCYSSACPFRGAVQAVAYCPRCSVAKYCSQSCQAGHWQAGHCRLCPRLAGAKLHSAQAAGETLAPANAGRQRTSQYGKPRR